MKYSERALCEECLDEYMREKGRDCSRCFSPLNKCTCANAYLESHAVPFVSKVFRYRSKAKDSRANMLIYSLKRDHRRDVIDFLAEEAANALEHNKDFLKNKHCAIVTSVPRRKTAIRKYGYDHAQLLAISIAKRLSVPVEFPLQSLSKRAQKEAPGEERFLNARFTLKKKTSNIKGKYLIIVDDVVTTGASMAAVAYQLRKIGARRTIGLSVSVAYKDS